MALSSRNAVVSHKFQSLAPTGATWARMRANISSLTPSNLPFRITLIVPTLTPVSELTAFAWLGYLATYACS